MDELRDSLFEAQRQPDVPSTPRQAVAARLNRIEALGPAIRTVEDRMTFAFVNDENPHKRAFTVGFAPPPLGGGEAWLDVAVVPLVMEIYAERGWIIHRDRNQLIFTLPEDTT